MTFLTRYRVQLLWVADLNKDIGFKFSLREEPTDGEKSRDGDLQHRDFNLANFNQSSAPTCVLIAGGGMFTPESQEPNPGRLDTEMKDPEVMIGRGDQQGFNAKSGSFFREEKRKCDECSWEGTRKAFGRHKRLIHGTRPELTKCEKCGTKACSLFPHKCRIPVKRLQDGCARKRLQDGGARKKSGYGYGGGTCGTCGFKTSDLVSHVLLRHSKKEQYLKEHYNIEINEEMKGGYNCHSCGKHFSKKIYLWRHICSLHGVVTKEELRESAMGKNMVEDNKSLEKNQTMTELDSVVSKMLRSMPAAVAEVRRNFMQIIKELSTYYVSCQRGKPNADEC